MATADLQLSNDQWVEEPLYEIANGQKVEKPKMGTQEAFLASKVFSLLSQSLGENPPGMLVLEVLFRLEPNGKLDRRPDIAFVPFSNWPNRKFPTKDPCENLPTLAIEIVSKSNKATEITQKIVDYFSHGVELIWVIYPNQKVVFVYEPAKKVQMLDEQDELNGGNFIPNFSLPLSMLFVWIE